MPKKRSPNRGKPAAGGNGRRRRTKPSPDEAPPLPGLSPDEFPGTATAVVDPPVELVGKHRTVAADTIGPNPWQVRRDFPQAELEEFGRSILDEGLLHRPVVREKPGYPTRLRKIQYELITGERRLRALRAVGIKEIPVTVIAAGDDRCRALVLIENVQRKDLDPIERGAGIRQLLDAEPGLTEAALGERIGMSQAEVSNYRRLLDLTEPWQKRIRAAEITKTHARLLLPFRDHPKLLSAIDKYVGKGRFEESSEMFEDLVSSAVHDATKPMEGKVYWQGESRRVFKPTAEQAEQLGIIEVKLWGNGKPERRATNVKLWTELQDEAAKREEAKSKARKTGGSKKARAASKPKKLTPAQQKKLAEEERQRKAEAARRQARRLWHLYCDWRRWLIAEHLRRRADIGERILVAVGLAAVWSGSRYDFDRSRRVNPDMLSKAALVEGLPKAPRENDKRFAALARLQPLDLEETTGTWLGACFWRAGEPVGIVPDGDLDVVCDVLEISLEAAWAEEQMGPLSEAWWNAHSLDDLAALARELKVELPKGSKKADAVQAFVGRKPDPDSDAASDDPLPWPKELAKIKEPKW